MLISIPYGHAHLTAQIPDERISGILRSHLESYVPSLGERELVEEARRVAKNYAGGSKTGRRLGDLNPAVYALMGAAAIGLVWLVASLI